MSKTLNEMVKVIVNYYDESIYEAANEIGVHYNTVDRLLKDEAATVQTGTTKKIEALYELIAAGEEPTAEAPTIEGENAAERLNYCLNVVHRCNMQIAEGEKAKKDKAAILPLMDEIYKEFRGGNFDGSHD